MAVNPPESEGIARGQRQLLFSSLHVQSVLYGNNKDFPWTTSTTVHTYAHRIEPNSISIVLMHMQKY